MLQKRFCLSTLLLRFLFLNISISFSIFLAAQNQLWTPLANKDLTKEKAEKLHDYKVFQLNNQLFLETINQFNSVFIASKKRTISLPLSKEELEEFELISAPILTNNLNIKYPKIQTYKIKASKDPSIQGRIAWTELGLYGHFIKNGESVFIEKIIGTGADNNYLVYKESDLKDNEMQSFICGNLQLKSQKPTARRNSDMLDFDTSLKTFRIAITATQQFTTATGGFIESALSSIVNSISSLNVIYEKDLGISFVLAENNDQLIFTEEHPAPFTDSEDAFGLWDEHPFLLDSIIGNENYDLGHVFAAECTGGVAGLAQLTGICSTENKGKAVSCVFNENRVEFRKTFYHEIGHQLGANHTWSNCFSDVNESQRHAPTAVEPGGGSTIMSYGGVCTPENNIVSTASDYLHGISIQEIKSALLSDSINCFQKVETENTMPEVVVRASGFYIPILTPFELEAEAFDEENTILTYCWEQFDTGAISEVGFPIASAPSFKSYTPSREAQRIFPRATNIILNNPSDVEVLPDTSRILTFGVTVRDNHPEGGSTNFAEVTFFATDSAGPFILLQPDSVNIEYAPNDSIEVLWEVANTDLPPVNCNKVDIYLSFDNGKEFPKLLAEAIPNNGQTKVLLPDTTTNRARIKVKCSNNIFFDMSNNRFKIREQIISATKNIYAKSINLYPNPAQNRLIIELPEISKKGVQLTVFDALGRKILFEQKSPRSNYFTINTSTLLDGVYLLSGKIGEQFFIKRFIIQK